MLLSLYTPKNILVKVDDARTLEGRKQAHVVALNCKPFVDQTMIGPASVSEAWVSADLITKPEHYDDDLSLPDLTNLREWYDFMTFRAEDDTEAEEGLPEYRTYGL